jgi:hypothetical protein
MSTEILGMGLPPSNVWVGKLGCHHELEPEPEPLKLY